MPIKSLTLLFCLLPSATSHATDIDQKNIEIFYDSAVQDLTESLLLENGIFYLTDGTTLKAIDRQRNLLWSKTYPQGVDGHREYIIVGSERDVMILANQSDGKIDLHVVEKHGGRHMWTASLDSWLDDSYSESYTIINRNTLRIPTQGANLYFSLNQGHLIKSEPTEPVTTLGSLQRGTIYLERRYNYKLKNSTLTAYSSTNGSIIWKKDGGLYFNLDASDSTVFFTTKTMNNPAELQAFDLKSGTLLWRTAINSGGGHYTLKAHAKGVAILSKKSVINYDEKSGQLAWSYSATNGDLYTSRGFETYRNRLLFYSRHPDRRRLVILDANTGLREKDLDYVWPYYVPKVFGDDFIMFHRGQYHEEYNIPAIYLYQEDFLFGP